MPPCAAEDGERTHPPRIFAAAIRRRLSPVHAPAAAAASAAPCATPLFPPLFSAASQRAPQRSARFTRTPAVRAADSATFYAARRHAQGVFEAAV